MYADTTPEGSQGAGNPINGAGGTLIVYVGGIISGNGTVVSQGALGTRTANTSISGYNGLYMCGASGGGSISVLSTSGGELVGLSATGGQPDFRGGWGGDGSARLLRTLAGPVVSARVRDLATLTAGAVVSTWGSWTSSTGTQPTYVLGTDGKYEVAFDRTGPQYMDAGPRTLNIFTNGGFTMVVQFKFTGTGITNEPIFVVGSVLNAFSNQISLLRGPNTSLRVLGGDGGVYPLNFNGGAVAQNTWVVVAVRYLRIDGVGYGQTYQNNVKVAEQNIGATTFANRTNAKILLGADVATAPTSDQEFNGSMRFAGMWDRALTDAELTGLYTSLTS
jgi:hypothetical protein